LLWITARPSTLPARARQTIPAWSQPSNWQLNCSSDGARFKVSSHITAWLALRGKVGHRILNFVLGPKGCDVRCLCRPQECCRVTFLRNPRQPIRDRLAEFFLFQIRPVFLHRRRKFADEAGIFLRKNVLW